MLYGVDGSKLAVMSGQTVTRAFVALPGGATAVYNASGLAWYRHADWLGSSRLASTPSRTLYSDNAYGAFGEQVGNPAGAADANFTGQNQDLAAGLLFDFPAREYHPGSSRWISPDPAGMAAVDPTNPQSWNRYAYVNNSPLNLVDPTGLEVAVNGGSFSFSLFGTGPNGCLWKVPMIMSWTTVGGEYGLSIRHDGPAQELICPSPSSSQRPYQPDAPGTGSGGGGGAGGTADPSALKKFKACMEKRASFFTVPGVVDMIGLNLGLGDADQRDSFVANALFGNTISSVYLALASDDPKTQLTNAATTATGKAISFVIPASMGTPLTSGRHTSDLMALNLAGKGGLPGGLPWNSTRARLIKGLKGLGGALGLDAALIAGDAVTCVLKPE
jgi:RHS repeat-associated protein